MTKHITLALVFAGVVAVNAWTDNVYQKTNVNYTTDLECANCIRSGNNFCLWKYGEGTQTVLSWNCTQTTDTWNITGGNGTYTGYACSYGMDQINSIVGSCSPFINQNTNDYCGPYIADLTDSNYFTVGSSIQKLPVNASCTYRAVSKCGYPEAYFRVHNESYRGDFDVAWAINTGMGLDVDADGTNRDWKPDWWSSSASDKNTEFYNLGEASRPNSNAAKIPDAEWNLCSSKYRSLWITITRTKDSSIPPK